MEACGAAAEVILARKPAPNCSCIWYQHGVAMRSYSAMPADRRFACLTHHALNAANVLLAPASCQSWRLPEALRMCRQLNNFIVCVALHAGKARRITLIVLWTVFIVYVGLILICQDSAGPRPLHARRGGRALRHMKAAQNCKALAFEMLGHNQRPVSVALGCVARPALLFHRAVQPSCWPTPSTTVLGCAGHQMLRAVLQRPPPRSHPHRGA